MKLKKGDAIIVTAGKDRGRKAKVEAVFPKKEAVLVAGINVYKRHIKRKSERQQGGIVPISRPLAVAKVALLCPSCGKPTRIGYVVARDIPRGQKGEKVRICRKCGKKV